MADKLNLTQVHQFKKVNLPDGRTITQLVKVDAYIRLGDGDGILYIQRGLVFSEAGPAISLDEVPGWFWSQLSHCSSESLIAAGWEMGSDAKVIKKALAERKKAAETPDPPETVVPPEPEVKVSIEPKAVVQLPEPLPEPVKKPSTKKTVAKKKAA